MRTLLRACATGLGVGFFPFAPGTAGSLLALALYCWIGRFPPGLPGHLTLPAVAFLAGVALLGVAASGRAEREFGEDASPIVIDEIVGQWIALAGLEPTVTVVVGGFLLFRILDILKPFPAGRSQGLPGGWGVMADDIVAGLYAALLLRGVLRFLPGGGT